MYISLQDIGIFLGLSIFVITCVFLILVLYNLNKLISGIREKLYQNDENIQVALDNLTKTSENLSEITTSLHKNKDIFDEKIPNSIENISSITSILKNTSEKVDQSLDVVNLSLVETASSVRENTQDIINYVKVISDAVKVLLQIISNRK
ncbi:methyl-accepting chemotaxis protein [Desulfitispora alkaliphila]|uniref:hypothetical protein n=1 Tax=Desulfitispora alkaliphila TaxID=622674 RepID=UPI003D1E4BE0